ncbi:hypothetical protein SOVF_181360, partial [Spinacia oleracea]
SGAAGLSSTLETGGSSGSIMFAASRAGAGAPDGRSVSGAAISSNALGSTGVIGYSRFVFVGSEHLFCFRKVVPMFKQYCSKFFWTDRFSAVVLAATSYSRMCLLCYRACLICCSVPF